jgi:hypothetical protein
VELFEEINKMQALATSPELYTEFVKLNGVAKVRSLPCMHALKYWGRLARDGVHRGGVFPGSQSLVGSQRPGMAAWRETALGSHGAHPCSSHSCSHEPPSQPCSDKPRLRQMTELLDHENKARPPTTQSPRVGHPAMFAQPLDRCR